MEAKIRISRTMKSETLEVPPYPERMLTIKEASVILGVSRGYVAELVDSLEIFTIPIGERGGRRIPRWALRQWQANKVKEADSSWRELIDDASQSVLSPNRRN